MSEAKVRRNGKKAIDNVSIGVGTVGAVGAAAPTNNWKGGTAPTR